MKDIPIIIQASVINEPIKGRCFLPINNTETMLSFLLRRSVEKYGADRVILAVSDRKEDNVFQKEAVRYGVLFYQGAYDNLAERLIGAIEAYGGVVENFIRVYAKNPLVDFKLMEELLQSHIAGGYDYSYNESLNGTIWGTGCEVFSVSLIRKFMKMPLGRGQYAALGEYIRQNSDKYKVYSYFNRKRTPFYKVNIETERDLEVVRELVASLSEIDAGSISSYLSQHKLLAEYDRESPLKETGTEKLLLNENKVQELRTNIDVDYTYPISVELTLTNQCNLRCVYCSDMDLRQRQGMGKLLSKNVLTSLFDDLARGGTRGVVLEGGGEPTLYKDFAEIVYHAKKVGLAVGLITNGTQSLDKKLLKEFEWIRVSLDASTAGEYQALKGVDCFEKVISNIAKYAQFCPSVGVGFVVTNNNISQIESLIIRLRELGVSYIQCRPVVDNEDLYPADIDLSYLTFYQTQQFGVVVEGMVENAESGNHGLPCRAHSITSIISGDGSVYICGRLNIYDWLKPIGNITRQSFHSIWNGDERRRQAKMIQKADFCEQNCPQCRISKFNTLLHKLSLVKSANFI